VEVLPGLGGRTTVVGLNERGVAVGDSTPATAAAPVVTWSASGELTDLTPEVGTWPDVASATSINDAGRVTGNNRGQVLGVAQRADGTWRLPTSAPCSARSGRTRWRST
jgi:hypothetical protein